MAKIDIDRFICSLIKLNGFAGMYNLSNTRKALESQGLKYDSETDEIVSIDPEFNGIPIRAGRWYVCDCEIINENQTVAFHKDEIYYCPKDGWLDVKGFLFKVGAFNIDFRPASDKEIEDHMETKFKAGDVVMYVSSHPAYSGFYLLGQPNDLHIGYSNAAEPYNIALRNCTIAKDSQKERFMEELHLNGYMWDEDKMHIVPATEKEVLRAKHGITGIGSKKAEGKLGEMISQRMESAKAKEALLPDGGLSEFEKGVKKWLGFNSTQPNDEDLKMIRKAANELLSIARKQIANEIDVDAMVDDYDTSYMNSSALSEIAHEHYRQGIEETLNKIKKGD